MTNNEDWDPSRINIGHEDTNYGDYLSQGAAVTKSISRGRKE
jgi:hypothetical protein